MNKITAVSFASQTKAQPHTDVPAKKKSEYPYTLKQHKTNSIVSTVAGSTMLGGVAIGIAKLCKAKNKTTFITGGIIAGMTLATGLIKGFNGRFQETFLIKKQKFENRT